MIKFIQGGNIFDSKCHAIVIPVNCVGVMGKGLALQAKKRYPERFSMTYQLMCWHKAGHLPTATHKYDPLHYTFVPGKLIWNTVDCEPVDGHTVCLMATKDHWRNPSKLEWVIQGIRNLRDDVLIKKDIKSVAIPALGCGCGGLPWPEVKQIIVTELNAQINPLGQRVCDLVDFEIYEPSRRSE